MLDRIVMQIYDLPCLPMSDYDGRLLTADGQGKQRSALAHGPGRRWDESLRVHSGSTASV
jgi:hypothetical protein